MFKTSIVYVVIVFTSFHSNDFSCRS